MWSRRARAVTVVIVALLAVPSAALGADTYVDDDTGNNANSCTAPSAPCQSILTAIVSAGANDTVHVDGGNYAEFVSLTDGKSLVEDDFNSGDGDSQAAIDPGALGPAVAVPSGGAAGQIRGFTVRSDALPVSLEGPATLTGNTFDDPDANTHVNLLDGAGSASVTANKFTDTPADTDDQIGLSSITTGSPTISGNSFENLGTAIHLANGSPTVSANTITGTRPPTASQGVAIRVLADATATIAGNDIHSPAAPGTVFGVVIVEDTATSADTGAALRRNEIFDHTTGVDVRETTGPVTLNGDVIAGSTSGGLFALDSAPDDPDVGDVDATNVTISDNSPSEIFPNAAHLDLDSSIVGPGGINDFNATCTLSFSRGPSVGLGSCDEFQTAAAPQFVNPGANNYHLQEGSPMIDAGNPVNPGFVTDLDGQARAIAGTCGGAPRRDIGADEFAPSCASPSPPPPPAGDVDPPETEITKGPKKKVKTRKRKKKAKLEFSSSDPGANFTCRLDGRPAEPCTSPFVAKVKRGKHVFEVYATDDADNPDPTPATHEWKLRRKRR